MCVKVSGGKQKQQFIHLKAFTNLEFESSYKELSMEIPISLAESLC